MIYEYECVVGHIIEAHVKLSGEGAPTSCTKVIPLAVQLTQAEFDALPEYSCSLPTGTTTGKLWKRDLSFRDPYHMPPHGRSGWMRGEYGARVGKDVLIHWMPIVLAPVPVPEGPCGKPVKRILSVTSPVFPGAGSWRGA